MTPLAVVVASQRATSHARSALPHAPVLEQPAGARPARPKQAPAALLRRVTLRLPGQTGRAEA
jgi:hypothetical protein